jgi:type I restriction enzyme S subunit
MLYLETKFKDTVIGSIPNDWDIDTIKETGGVVTGKTPSTKNASFWNGDIPFVTPTDINRIKIQGQTERKVTESGLKESKEIPAGSLMVTCIASIGKNAISKERCCTNQQINSIIPNADFDVDYLYYAMERMKPQLGALAGKTAVPILNKTRFEQVRLAKPKKIEQHKIAEILSNIDGAIQKTDQLVTSTHKLKMGFMQVLLKEGIGHKKFKEIELGKIPEEWKVIRLGTVVSSYKNGIYKPAKFNGRGHPCIRMFNIVEGRVNTLNAPLLDVTEQELWDYGLEEGDILVNRVNTTELVGKAGVVPQGLGKITFESKNIRIRLDKSVILPEFFSIVAQTKIYSVQVLAKAKTAVAQATITQEDLDDIILPLPSVPEQKEIIAIITNLDKKLDVGRLEYAALNRIRQGFMRELLSGRIRVK